MSAPFPRAGVIAWDFTRQQEPLASFDCAFRHSGPLARIAPSFTVRLGAV